MPSRKWQHDNDDHFNIVPNPLVCNSIFAEVFPALIVTLFGCFVLLRLGERSFLPKRSKCLVKVLSWLGDCRDLNTVAPLENIASIAAVSCFSINTP